MILGEVLNLKIFDWEERVLAAVWLGGTIFEAEAFMEDSGQRMSEALKFLSALPFLWVRELCIECLLSSAQREEHFCEKVSWEFQEVPLRQAQI